jgi:murein DD-endopeptidase MepM/ murein hydrolase activator NlpD|tara:strand:- start:217 stop:1158 length:942 start_codon:yes stop_codon:yes gene_type:complete
LKKRVVLTLTGINKSYQVNYAVRSLTLVCCTVVLIAIAWCVYLGVTLSKTHQLQRELTALNTDYEYIQGLLAQDTNKKNILREQLTLTEFQLNENQHQLGNLTRLLNYSPVVLDDVETQYLKLTDEVSFRKLALQLLPNGHPLDFDRVSSKFGKRNHPISHTDINHLGVDLTTPTGSPIYATADGVVIALQNNPKSYGKLIKINHGLGFSTIYGHLNKINVDRNEVVIKNQLIGYSGNTGLSTGPHLHYEVRFGHKAINPLPFMQWSLVNFDKIQQQTEELPWDSLKTNMLRLITTPQRPLLPKVAKLSVTLK